MSKLKVDELHDRAIAKLKRLAPNAIYDLWEGNVINGERLLRCADLAHPGTAIFMDDAADVLMLLWKAGIVEPIKFNPSHSRAAFLGLGGKRGKQTKPNHGTAGDWEWRIIKTI